MTVVRSTWAMSPILLDGSLSSPEWADAGKMPIPAGYLLVKNDNHFLYVALDLIADQCADPGVGDYFWLSFDNDGNRAITPRVDVNYGIYPTLPIRIGRQYYLGPGTWTGLLNEPSTAAAINGFGPSPNSPSGHRIWEMRLPLSEIGIPSLGTIPNPSLFFGLRVASSNPGFTYDFPAGFYTNFSGLNEIMLTCTPTIPNPGPVIGGVGLIPATKISGGYATTDPGYYVPADEAAFGGTLNIIGNRTTLQNLWAAGARKYKILYRPGTSGTFVPLLQSWQNYRWNGTTYSLEGFTSDAENKYPLVNPSDDYSIDDLLIQWNTVGVCGIYEMAAEFYNATGTVISTTTFTPIPPPTSTVPQLQLMIDNNLPFVDIIQVLHNGAAILPCAMETMTDANDGVQVKITVNDYEGNLKDLALYAFWGNGNSAPVYSDSYPPHRNTWHQWNGVTSQNVPAGEWVPPVTCAYQFRLSATARVTNGYCYIGYVEDTFHVSLIKPSAVVSAVSPCTVQTALPLGQPSLQAVPTAGTQPKVLGV